MKHKTLKIILALMVFGIIFYILLLYYVWHPEKGTRYLFPEGYRGWICVTYNATDATPLKKEDGFLVLMIPPDGIVRTSSSPNTYTEEGYYVPTYDEHYYYSEKGKREAKVLAQGGGYTVQTENSDEFTSYFWISTKKDIEQDYEMFVKNSDVLKLPQCGQWIKQLKSRFDD